MRHTLILMVLLWSFTSFAADTPDKILARVRDRNDGKDYISDVLLRITDDSGTVRERSMFMIQKDMDRCEKVILHFYDPGDVRDVAFMMVTYPEVGGQPDDQWMYFPAFRKIRRIAAQDKRGSFMGSAFAYTDLDKLRVSEYTSTLVGEETLLDRPVWVIDRTPVSQDIINKTGYHRVRLYIDKERDLILKQEYFDIKGIMFKEQVSVQVEQVEGIWTITRAVMTQHDKRSVSEMIFNAMNYNVGLDDDLFSQRALKRGINKAGFAAWSNR